MTDIQLHLSHWRAVNEEIWRPNPQPDQQENPFSGDFLGNSRFAKQRGEQTFEIDLCGIELPATKLEAVAQALITHPDDALDNTSSPIRRKFREAVDAKLKSELIRQINEKYPAIVEAAKTYQQNHFLLWKMFSSDGRGSSSKSDLYNIEAARHAFQENRAIAEKFGFQWSHVFLEDLRLLTKFFKEIGGEDFLLT